MKNRKVLIVEYKTDSTGNLVNALKALRYNTKKMSFRLADLSDVVKDFLPDILIVDMSVHADKNIIAKASAVQNEFSTPVIYFTEAINSRTLYQTMKTNHYGYIYKPYDESTLQTTIELALHKHKNDISVKVSEHKFKELFNNMTSGVVVFEYVESKKSFRLTDTNKAAEEIIGRTKEEVIGKPLTEIFPNSIQYGLLDTIKRVKETKVPASLKTHYYEDDKIKGWFNSHIYLLPTGECVHIFHDITEQVEAEDGLRSKQKELEILNVELAKAVVEETDKRKKNEQVVFEQSRFLAMGQMISAIEHQWRQPLSALGINIEDLEDAYHIGDLDSEYIHDLTVDSMSLVKTISKTMEDLNNFFKTSQEEEDFYLLKNFDEIFGLIKARLLNSDISIHMAYRKDDSTFEADDDDIIAFVKKLRDFKISGIPAEFKQVMINLINNAIDAILERKRTSKEYVQGLISLELEKRKNNVSIYIRDNGVGISHETITKIFEPYYSTKENGAGIGLYMSKVIIEEHMDGTISASPLPNGAIFTINLPVK